MPRGCGAWRFRSGARLRRCVVAVWVIAAWVAAHLQSYALLADAMTVSRTFHDPPGPASWCHARFTSHQGRPGLFHARFTSHQRHGARRLRLDQRATTRRHLTVVTPSRPRTRPTLSHAIPQRHRSTTPQKPHDFNVSVSKSEILAGELHATFAGLHPLRSITPDQSGCNAH